MHAGDAVRRGRPGVPPGYREVRSPVAEWIARPECSEAIARGEADALFVPHDRRLAPRATAEHTRCAENRRWDAGGLIGSTQITFDFAVYLPRSARRGRAARNREIAVRLAGRWAG